MLHIVICDDDNRQNQLIQAATEKYFAVHTQLDRRITVFSGSMQFLDHLDQSGVCDIALLDICMPGMLGTDVAREIRRRHDKTEIIFLTTSDEYAVDAFALKATHYLMKPFTQAQFDEAMDRAVARFSDRAPKQIAIRSEDGKLYNLDLDDILCIESQGHGLAVVTKERTVCECRRSLSRLLEELERLSPAQFISPYKGYIVNQKAIRTIEKDRILLKNGSRIPIPKRGYRELQNTYFDYMFGEGRAK